MTTDRTMRDAVVTLIQQKGTDLKLSYAVDIENQVQAAVLAYSKERPYRTITDRTGDGSSYDFTLPTGFDATDNISVIYSVEWPAGEYQDPKTAFVDPKDWMIYQSATSTYVLRFRIAIPSSGDTVRITAGIPHTLDSTSSTIPAEDEPAVQYKAAELCCLLMAAQSARTGNPIIAGDTVNHRTKEQEWRSVASEFRRLWESAMDIEDGVRAGFAVIERDLKRPSGRSFLTHPSREH